EEGGAGGGLVPHGAGVTWGGFQPIKRPTPPVARFPATGGPPDAGVMPASREPSGREQQRHQPANQHHPPGSLRAPHPLHRSPSFPFVPSSRRPPGGPLGADATPWTVSQVAASVGERLPLTLRACKVHRCDVRQAVTMRP